MRPSTAGPGCVHLRRYAGQRGRLTTPTTTTRASPVSRTPGRCPDQPAGQPDERARQLQVQADHGALGCPGPNGTAKVTKYRAKVYLVSGNTLKYRTSCTAKSRAWKCRTKKLLKGRTYVVKVQARNSKGYGQFAAPVRVRVR